MQQHFASDNNAGICPEALAALIEANAAGHAPAYGDDPWTERAVAAVRALLEAPQAGVFFVFNGTASNAIALAQVCRPHHAIIAHESAHIATDEAGAPGFFSGGGWLRTASGPHAKLRPCDIAALADAGRGVHSTKPRAISLTQATERGTVYTAAELAALSEAARQRGLVVHMDGARFANAVASTRTAPADISWRAGVDILSFGGVKNGLGVGEAIVVFEPGLAAEVEWRIKQSGQLNSKMRLVTAPWAALIESGAWLGNARHANAMAQRLAGRLAELDGIAIAEPVEANAVFVEMPPPIQALVRARGWRFYTFAGESLCRLMCAWDTAPDTVDRFAADIEAATRSRNWRTMPGG
jgi:threonine aldolase